MVENESLLLRVGEVELFVPALRWAKDTQHCIEDTFAPTFGSALPRRRASRLVAFWIMLAAAIVILWLVAATD